MLSPIDEVGHNILEDSISMIERTSIKIYPIVKEVLKKMIDETPKDLATAVGTINRTDQDFNMKTTVSPIYTSQEMVKEEINF
jgi:hypothetical protein